MFPAASCFPASIRGEAEEELLRALDRMGASRILEVNAKIEFPFEILVERPSKPGPDRLAAAAGVVALGGREAIVVDAGTAITSGRCSRRRDSVGGTSLPGHGAFCIAPCAIGTAALPLVAGSGGAVRPRPGPTRGTRGQRGGRGGSREGARFALSPAFRIEARPRLRLREEEAPVSRSARKRHAIRAGSRASRTRFSLRPHCR